MGLLKWFNKERYSSLGDALGCIKKELEALQPQDSADVSWNRSANGISANIRKLSGGSEANNLTDDAGVQLPKYQFTIIDSSTDNETSISVINGNDPESEYAGRVHNYGNVNKESFIFTKVGTYNVAVVRGWSVYGFSSPKIICYIPNDITSSSSGDPFIGIMPFRGIGSVKVESKETKLTVTEIYYDNIYDELWLPDVTIGDIYVKSKYTISDYTFTLDECNLTGGYDYNASHISIDDIPITLGDGVDTYVWLCLKDLIVEPNLTTTHEIIVSEDEPKDYAYIVRVAHISGNRIGWLKTDLRLQSYTYLSVICRAGS